MPPKKKITRILNCMPSKGTEQDWFFSDAAEAGMTYAMAPGALPASIDLRAAWWDIGDQLDTGSCVGWGTGDAVVRWHMVQCNRILPTDHLSVRYIWMAAKETDEFKTRPSTFIENEGTSLKAALDVARKYGVVLEKLCPFLNGRLYRGSARTFYATAARLRINAYYNLGRGLDTWRTWLVNNGPILTRLDVDDTWDEVDASGRLEVYKPNTARGGHAVALVGYTPDAFIVRNSWGTGWADHGYAYASLSYAEQAFTEAYGVAV